MDGEYTSVTRRRLESAELAAVSVRLVVLVALALVHVLTGDAVGLDAASIAVGAFVVLAIGYSVISLRLVARSAFGPYLADLSAVIDATAGSLFLWLALHPASGEPRMALAGAAVVAVPLSLAVSLLRFSPRNVLVAGGAAFAGTAAAVLALLASSGGGEGRWVWLFLPLGCLTLGAGLSVVAYSNHDLLRKNVASQDLQRASRRLRMTMEIVQVSVANFGQFVNNLERVSAALSEGARNQALSIDRVSSAVSALNSSQERIYVSAETSAKTIRRTVDSSDTGNRVVKRVIEEMRSISDAVDRMVSSLERIDDIADNTNLLALNANIEANRGGAESMGFSVVADEIRNLAEQSQETAVEVGRLVKQIVKVIVAAGASSKSAGEVFDKINMDLSGFSDYVNNLHLSVQEQLKANRDVQRAVSRIHEVTVDNTQAADRVRDVVGELQKEVGKLKALVDGKVTETAALS